MFACELQFPEAEGKGKAIPLTPMTAQGLTPEVIHDLVGFDKEDSQISLFSTLSCVNQSQFIQTPERTSTLYDLPKNAIVQEKDFTFKFRVEISKQDGTILKVMHKEIDSLEEKTEFISCILSRQHEKFKVQRQHKYNANIFIVNEEGYERCLTTFQICLQDIDRKERFFSLNCKDSRLDIEIETYKDTWIKVLGLKLSEASIQSFFQERFELLNKSDRLNSLSTISELKGLLYPLSKQNMGSRIIQKLLLKASPQQLEQVVTELKSYFPEMVTNRYGNYVFQKIIKKCCPKTRKSCLSFLSNKLPELVCSKAGTFCLQGILDFLDYQDFSKILVLICQNIVKLCNDQFASHFIQKLVQKNCSEVLIVEVSENLEVIATDKYGTVLVKHMMKECAGIPQLRYSIANACIQQFNTLCFHEFGHYIIEEMFKYYQYCELEGMLHHIVINIEPMSVNQYSSGILRRCIEAFGDYMAVPMIQKLLEGSLRTLMEDCSGNFVLHRLMELTQNQYYVDLLTSSMVLEVAQLKTYQKRQKWTRFFKL